MTTLLQRFIQIERDIEKNVLVRAKGHAFVKTTYGAKCVGCGECVQTKQQSPSAEDIKKAALGRNDIGQCRQPWILSERIKAIKERHRKRVAGQSKDQTNKITLESVNEKLDAIDAKLDRIIRHWRIYG
jgi:flagellar motility protein MotE (MotC chaperone)